MKGGYAGTWAQNYQANYIDWEYQTFAHSFNKFMDRLNKAFTDLNRAANAQCELSNLRLGKKSYDEFFQQFEIYA